MKFKLTQDSYGKSAVRVAKVTRHADFHTFIEVHVNIQLEGDFETVYTEGDNRQVLPTDTMKNTIFALAKEHPLENIESFALFLADYFLKNNPQVSKVRLDLNQVKWDKMLKNGKEHPYAYIGGGNEKATTHLVATRENRQMQSGISQLRVLKTTESGFENYIVDKYTTLPPTADRILATEMEVVWTYSDSKNVDFTATRNAIREALLTTFSQHNSLSVQHTLYDMGAAALKSAAAAAQISLKMPNLHYIPINMKPFGVETNNEVFVASGDAYGFITGTITRE